MKAISISLVSALAIAASPAALAQVETADLVIPQDQVERVQAYCEELVASVNGGVKVGHWAAQNQAT